jgi:glycerol-3-phosphate acyltransferase PlsY
MLAKEILVIVLGYLLGSIPFAYILGRAVKGIDIRRLGNVGTLSVMREVGTIEGLVNLVLDIGKGSLAVGTAQWLHLPSMFVFAAGFAAVLGHSWPVFIHFKGGGAVATTLGVLLGLAPLAFGVSFAIIVVVVLFTSNFRFGAGVGLLFLPLFIWLFGGHINLIVYSLALPLFLVLRNIPKFKQELTKNSSKSKLIVDRDYTPWQTRRRKID